MERTNRNQFLRNIASSSNSSVPLPPIPSEYLDTMNQHYAYAENVEAAAQETIRRAMKNRPKNTTKSYQAKKEEFIRWCHKYCPRGPLNEIVDDRKLHFFLLSQVVNRDYKKKGTKRRHSDNDNDNDNDNNVLASNSPLPSDSDLMHSEELIGEVIDDNELTNILLDRAASSSTTPTRKVGIATVKMYIAAIVDLYNDQAIADPHSNRPHPRGKLVEALLRSVENEQQQHRRENYVDRGIGTAADGYSTTAEMEKLVQYYFGLNTQEGLRNSTTFLLQHYGLLRGESLRMMEFPDLQSMLLENEGITPCYALVMVLKQGKTNQEGRLEFAACLRNKNVTICPQMMLSFYLFYRWHIAGEPFPSFNENRDWFDIKLTRSKNDPKKSISYDHHLNCIKEAFKAVGLHSKAKTHAMRGSGSRMAEMLGTSESAIRRLGRWNSSALTTSYLTHLPREALRTLAGFTREAGQFYLVRATVMPPEGLCNKVFPRLNYWVERLNKGEVTEISTAADGFLQLLIQLRIVLLQDSVIIKKMHPHHPLWHDPLFQDELYLQFERDLNHALETTEEPADILLQRAVPHVENHLKDVKNQIAILSSQIQALETTMQNFQSLPNSDFQQLEPFLRVNNEVRSMMQQWNRLVTQGATLNVRFNMEDQVIQQQREQQQSDHLENEVTNSHTEEVPPPPPPPPPPSSSSSSLIAATNDTPGQFSFSFSSAESTTSFQQPSVQITPSSSSLQQQQRHQQATIDRSVTEAVLLSVQAFKNTETLTGLWRIWFDGLPGHHPICKYDEIYGIKNWRGSSAESKFYQRRKRIIQRIEAFIRTESYSKDDALKILEEKRVRNNPRALTIHYIAENLDEFFA